MNQVCIVGTGRVGLPLALALLEKGLNVVGVDRDATLRACVNAGTMPFAEPGFDELVATKKFQIQEDIAIAGGAEAIIVTVGTPLHNHIETDLRQIRAVLSALVPHLRPQQLLCLRSTVAPKTTHFVRGYIEKHSDLKVGENFFLAFCPERIAEGKAYQELRELPQIIGAEDPQSHARAEALFSRLSPQIMHCDFTTAELVKLFNNTARYVEFALANQFALIADTFDANIYEIRELANTNYPRNGIAAPGFTAGTCLRKDFGMINEWSPYPDLLLSAWKMNEYIPAFLVSHLKKRTPIEGMRVAILGYTFKKDTDDIRDSLAPKLHRYIERELPESICVSDHNLPEVIEEELNGRVENYPLEEALRQADCVFVATNHSPYASALRSFVKAKAWIVDIWNVTGCGQVFYQAEELKEKA